MAARQVEDLKEFFKCIICMEQLRDARLCPHCSKLTCYLCIRKWLMERQSQCPHCRTRLNLDEVVRCRWADELREGIDRLQTDEAVSSAETPTARDRCNLHNEKLSVYCWTCQACICHHCALWGGQHSGHALKPLHDEYRTQVGKVNAEMKKLRRRWSHLINALQQLESNVDTVRKAKEERAREIWSAVELMIARLDASMKNKIVTLTSQKPALIAEVELIERLVHEVDHDVANLSQSDLIARSSDILRSLGEVQRPSLAALVPVSSDFVSEIIPPYDCHTMTLQNFTQLRTKAEPVYSSPLVIHGMSWRLKVYPDGNGIVRGYYLSVFLELTNGPTDASKYEYRVDMVHKDGDPSRNVVREFASDFEVGECWGYNRFFKLDCLSSEGFLDGESDCLTLRFQVRAPTYYQKCKVFLWHISKLEATCSTRNAEIERMTQQLLAGSIHSDPAPSEQEVDSATVAQREWNESTDFLSNTHFMPIEAEMVPSRATDTARGWKETKALKQRVEDLSAELDEVGLNVSSEFDYDSLLPGEVPVRSRCSLENWPAVSVRAQRDVDDESEDVDNTDDLEGLWLVESLAGMNLDFTVPDRELPHTAYQKETVTSSVARHSSLPVGNVGRTRRRVFGSEAQGIDDVQESGALNAAMCEADDSSDQTDEPHSVTPAHDLVAISCKNKSRTVLYRGGKQGQVHQQEDDADPGTSTIEPRVSDSDTDTG